MAAGSAAASRRDEANIVTDSRRGVCVGSASGGNESVLNQVGKLALYICVALG